MNKRVLIITGDGGESYETWFAVHRFQEAGYETHVAAPSKRRLHLVMHDFEPGWDTYREAPGYAMDADLTFADVKVPEYEAVVCIGGRAPEYLRNDPDCQRIVRHFYNADAPVAQLCHGPLIAGAAGVLEGRRTAAYPALEPDIRMAGAEFVDGDAIVDGQVVSGRAWPDHPAWMHEFVDILRAKAPVGLR